MNTGLFNNTEIVIISSHPGVSHPLGDENLFVSDDHISIILVSHHSERPVFEEIFVFFLD